MDDPVQVGPVNDDTVRVEHDGETHGLTIAVDEQLSRDLDAVIETLQSDRNEGTHVVDEDNDPDREFVDVFTSFEERLDSLEDVAAGALVSK